MKKLVLLCGALLALTAVAANAQVHLAVNDCGGAAAATWTCTSNSGTAVAMVASLVCPADLAQVTGEEATMEVAFNVPVPLWWQSGTGKCRAAGSFGVGYSVPISAATCMDYFGGVSAIVGSNSYQIGPDAAAGDPNGPIDANRIRIRTLSAVDYAAALLAPAPAGGDEIFIFSLTINKAKTVGTGACAGCGEGACAVIKRIKLSQASNINPETIQVAGDLGGFVTLQNGAGLDCPRATPATRGTWGQLKSLYR